MGKRNTGVATVGSTGSVTGVAAGTTTISYTLATGCYAVTTFTVTSASVTPPSITAQPVSQYGCIVYRSIFSVTASPSTGGHTLSYAWRKSGVNITGATNSVYIIHSVANTDTGTSIYSCVITDNQDGGTATSINVSLILNKQAVFNGATNSWTTGSNWSTGAQPDSTIHAYIPATAVTMPNVTTGTVRCKCLTIESGASLTVNGGAIEIAGRINNSGTFTATNGAITLNGTIVAQTIPAATFYSNTIKELQVANSVGVSLGGALRLTGTYTPTSGVFASGGFLTLASSSAGTANVARGSAGGGYITGDVIVERYMPANSHRAWRLLAPSTVGAQTLKAAWQEGASTYPSNPAPGYGTLITCSSAYSRTAGFDTITAQQSVQLWDITNQSWTTRRLTNTNTKIYSSEPGYFIYLRGDRTVSPSSSIVGATPTVLRSKGALRMGDQAAITVPVSKGVLVGNPYASAIDFSLISPADRPNLPKRFWLWDPVLTGTSGLGAYVIFDSTTSTPWMPSVTGGSYSAPNSIIPSGMAFLLQPGVATGSITLRESHKVNSHSNVGFKQNNIHTRELHIGLAAAGPDGLLNNADGIFTLYKDQTAAEVDDDDAVKMVNPGENIALSRDGHDLAIEARPDMNADDTLFIKMWNMVNKAYRLTFKPANFGNSGKTAVLHDRYLNTNTPVSLESASKYDFEVSGEPASASATRFYIVYQSKNGYNDNINAGDIAVYPNPAENYKFTLLVNYADAAEYEISLLNGSGVSVHNEKYVLPTIGKLEKPISLHKNVPSGNYILVVGKNGKQYKSVNVVIK